MLFVLGLGAGLGTSDASAAAIGSLATSTGLLATLLAVFAMKGWPTLSSASTVSTAGGALLIAGAVAWLVPRQAGSFRTAWRALLPRFGRQQLAACHRSADTVRLDGGFESELTSLFLRVHQAWDRFEFDALSACMTADMLDELLQARGHGVSSEVWRRTDVVTVQAEVVSIDQLSGAALASVVFSGSMREGAGSAVLPFRELWLLIRADEPEAPWKLARHQAFY